MITSTTVHTQISNQGAYYRSLGYAPELCRKGVVLEVGVSDLAPNSNMKVSVVCDTCGGSFIRKYQMLRQQGSPDMCVPCRRIHNGKITDHSHLGIVASKQVGVNHPRWNPNKSELRAFSRRVHWLTKKTYQQHETTINPNHHPRTRCGVDGGYQLDHIVPIRRAFDLKMDARAVF